MKSVWNVGVAIACIGALPFGATLAWSPAARAQDPTASASNVDSALAALGQGFSSPPLPPSLPATPERLKLAREFIAKLGIDGSAKFAGTVIYSQSKAQIAASIKNLPPAKQTLVMAAFDKAFQVAEARREQRALDRAATYYVTRFTDDELRQLTAFVVSPLGQKMLHPSGPNSSAERQQIGQYLVGHPVMIKFTKANFDIVKFALADREAAKAAFTADFQALFCRNLAEVGLKMSTCRA